MISGLYPMKDETQPITARQREILDTVNDCDGNCSEAARRLGTHRSFVARVVKLCRSRGHELKKARVKPLTKRQREVLEIVENCNGNYAEAARRLSISSSSIRHVILGCIAKGHRPFPLNRNFCLPAVSILSVVEDAILAIGLAWIAIMILVGIRVIMVATRRPQPPSSSTRGVK